MDTKRITLGGRDFDVPPLPFRQIRIVTMAAQRLNSADFSALTEQNLIDLFEIAFTGAQKGKPDLTREQLEDMHVTVQELQTAKRPVCEQAGMIFLDVGEPPARD